VPLQPPPAPPAPPRPGARELALGLALPAAVLVAPAAFSGLADPYELNAVDVARRAALHLFGAPWLALPGAENRLPTLGDVGRGELPALAVALAQRAFGLGAFSARAPVAIAGALGLAALWLWVRRIAGPRAGAHAAWVLATVPLYAVQSRSANGEAMAMAALVASFAGLSALLFDARLTGLRAIGWALTALAGLAVGFACRGAVFGLAVPLVSTGAASLLTRAISSAAPPTAARRTLALAALAGGAIATGAGAYALARATPARFSYALGAASFEGLRYPTFDQTLRQIAHGFFPWGAFLPAAFALLASPPARALREEDALAFRARVALVLGAFAAYAAHAWLAPAVGPLPFVGTGLLAAALALALDELERLRRPLRTLALATAAFTTLLALDLVRLPDATLAASLLSGAALPEGFARRMAPLWACSAALFAAALLLALTPAWSARSCATARIRRVVRRDRIALAGGVLAALVPCVVLYPELSARWSPREAFAAYRERRRADEPLGLFGVASRSPAYYGEPDARPFADAPAALAWLEGAEAPSRRWLLVRAVDLPELNSLWRARRGAALDRNLPLLDASSGYFDLVASSLREGERNVTPLAAIVGDELPRPPHPLDAQLGDELDVLGWGLYDGDDRQPVEALTRGRTYVLRVYYRVIATPTLPWRAFMHLEGGAQRHTADHGFEAYSTALWQPGDIITDRSTLRLEPNFAPGVHSLFFGLYHGEARLPVARGRHDGDRVEAGAVRVN
jgi:dolichyl-phosphate-mannose-protein mannosyltransferase